MLLLLKLIPKRFISNITGILSDLHLPKWILIPFLKLFVKAVGINLEESIYPLSHFKTVNQFFTRPIKPNCRPIKGDSNVITCPVDGTIIEYGDIYGDKALQIKGIPFYISDLIASKDYSERFFNGQFITLYLSPKSYHRIHTPYSGTAIAAEYNRGELFPVNDFGLNNVQGLFTTNERLTTFFETPFGLSALVKVGATNVGRIKTNYPLPWTKHDMKSKRLFQKLEPVSYSKGDEFARFEMGSTVIILFEKDSVTFMDLKPRDFIKLGEPLAKSR